MTTQETIARTRQYITAIETAKNDFVSIARSVHCYSGVT